MATVNIRKNFSLTVDGRGYAGQVEEFTPPKLTVKTEDFRAGGMNAPIAVSMGMEKLECEFTLGSYSPDILVAWEVREGSNIGVTLREVLEDYDGTQRGATHVMRGKIIEIDNGTLKAGDKASMKVKMALKYYKATHNGVTKQEIDVENMVQIAGGVDALATTRGILGI